MPASVYDDARERAGALHRRNMRALDDLTSQGIDGLHRGRTAVERFVDDNPLLVGVVGVAAGLLLGALLPRTRQEDQNIGPWADEVRDQGLRYAREVTNIGREFVQTALDPDNLNAAARKVADPDGHKPPEDERTRTTSDAGAIQAPDAASRAPALAIRARPSAWPRARDRRTGSVPVQPRMRLAEQVLLHLAHGVARQLVHEQDALGALEPGEPTLQGGLDAGLVRAARRRPPPRR